MLRWWGASSAKVLCWRCLAVSYSFLCDLRPIFKLTIQYYLLALHSTCSILSWFHFCLVWSGLVWSGLIWSSWVLSGLCLGLFLSCRVSSDFVLCDLLCLIVVLLGGSLVQQTQQQTGARVQISTESLPQVCVGAVLSHSIHMLLHHVGLSTPGLFVQYCLCCCE